MLILQDVVLPSRIARREDFQFARSPLDSQCPGSARRVALRHAQHRSTETDGGNPVGQAITSIHPQRRHILTELAIQTGKLQDARRNSSRRGLSQWYKVGDCSPAYSIENGM